MPNTMPNIWNKGLKCSVRGRLVLWALWLRWAPGVALLALAFFANLLSATLLLQRAVEAQVSNYSPEHAALLQASKVWSPAFGTLVASFFADGGPLLGTLVATTPSSKCFSRCSYPWYMVISSSCWSLPELDTDLQPYFATSIPIDSSAGNSEWYVCDEFASVSRIATSFWYKLDICMLREYEVTTIYLPIYIQ
jgi:hypothetical protein